MNYYRNYTNDGIAVYFATGGKLNDAEELTEEEYNEAIAKIENEQDTEQVNEQVTDVEDLLQKIAELEQQLQELKSELEEIED